MGNKKRLADPRSRIKFCFKGDTQTEIDMLVQKNKWLDLLDFRAPEAQ
jgi:hypothetical protein